MSDSMIPPTIIPHYPDLAGKKILVTGASRGIGKAIALALGRQGAFVAFNYRGETDKAAALKAEIEQAGGRAEGLAFDVTRSEQIRQAVKAFSDEHGPIEGLVNNAGISKDQLFLRLKEDDLQAILETNLKGAIMTAQILCRGFLKVDNASIVNISSIVGLMGNASQAAYAASKAGLIGLTKSLAKELASRQVRCNAICPGLIETEMTQSLDDKAKESYLDRIPLGRFGSGEEVSGLTCFLLSQASSYLTGDIIKIDGGLYI